MKAITLTAADNNEYTVNVELITYMIRYDEANTLMKFTCGTELVIPQTMKKVLELISIAQGEDSGRSESIH